MDEDLKKMLNDLKMDDLIQELENLPEKQHEQVVAPRKKSKLTASPLVVSTVALVSLGLCSFAFLYKPTLPPQAETSSLVAYADAADMTSAENSDDAEVEDTEEYNYENPYKEREQLAASWAKKVVQIDPALSKSIHELWGSLRQRNEDLQESAGDLSNLLFDNGRRRQDFYGKEAELLLARYQAVDARHSMQIANQINAIYVVIEPKHNPELNQAYAEMLAELGAEKYTSHQVQIAKELLSQEWYYSKALHAVIDSASLKELQANLQQAKNQLAILENNGIVQTFQQIDQYQNQLFPSVKEGLDRLLFAIPQEKTFDSQESQILKNILESVGASEEAHKHYLEQFEKLVKNEPAQSLPKPGTKIVQRARQSAVAFN